MDPTPVPLTLVRCARVAWLALFAFLGLGLAETDVRAQDATAAAATAGGLDAALEQQVRTLAQEAGEATPTPGVTRFEVIVGRLDPRLHLAPCERIEPHLPAGTRLWGRTRIGLRCAQGPSPWNVFLPITVRAWGRGLVATGGATAGTTLQATDVAIGEVDLAETASPPLLDPEQAVGRLLAQPLRPGQSVRLSHLRARQWFAAGDTVRVVAVGEGFRLEGEGQALSNGVEGQPARVRTESGRIVTGQPVADRRMEVPL
jgi:flagella basal body P-ring formation protein FlgA